LVDGERREDALGDSVRRPLDILNGHACIVGTQPGSVGCPSPSDFGPYVSSPGVKVRPNTLPLAQYNIVRRVIAVGSPTKLQDVHPTATVNIVLKCIGDWTFYPSTNWQSPMSLACSNQMS
jgi:hypothetical protein